MSSFLKSSSGQLLLTSEELGSATHSVSEINREPLEGTAQKILQNVANDVWRVVKYLLKEISPWSE